MKMRYFLLFLLLSLHFVSVVFLRNYRVMFSPILTLYIVLTFKVMAGDTDCHSVIKLSNSTVLYLREVNKYLALVCLLKSDVFEKQGLIDYNFLCLKKAILEVYEVGKRLNNREI